MSTSKKPTDTAPASCEAPIGPIGPMRRMAAALHSLLRRIYWFLFFLYWHIVDSMIANLTRISKNLAWHLLTHKKK